jgi:hypothetical protein
MVAATMGVWLPRVSHAHFVLQSPANWAEQDSLGAPQKSAPCGQADAQISALPTNARTTYEPGQIITVSIDEVVYHPGHYRVVLSTTGRAGLPADPQTTVPGTCMALEVQNPPVFPVLADGVLPHTEPLEGPQSFSVTLPKDVTCTDCTLQVLEFMSAEVGASANCFYHHCADLSIVAKGTGAGGSPSSSNGGEQAGGAGAPSCALSGGALASGGIGWLLCALVPALAAVRRKLRPA